MKSNKNKPFRLRFFWPFSIFLGILFFLLVFFTSANDDIESTEEHLADTVNYLKKQCSTYSNLNLASETKSLMRIIECCQQAAHNISTDNRLHGTTSMEKASMEEFTKDLYITGIIFLDETGTVTSEYCTDSIGSAGLTDTLEKEVLLDVAIHPEKTYSSRIDCEDGSYIDLAAVGRTDTSGIIVTYYHTPLDYIESYSISFQNLLSGYSISRSSTIVITSGDKVIASNEEKLEGTDIKDIEVLDGQKVEKDDTEAVYNGIVIDGEFADWDAVKKYDAVCPNDAHNECISKTAMMFDGDYVYVYVKDGTGGDASGAGTHSNGRYSITTDLGYELVFQLDSKGYVNGVDGVDCRHVGNQWEIAVPKSALPAYNKTISFGLYRSEPFISGTANIKDDGSSDDKIIYDIRYDGLYGDWEYYPHTTIQYSTAGTHHNMVDSAGALFSNGSTVLGHVYTVMPEHLNEAGGEFTQAVTFKFNDSYNQVLYPRFVTVDEQGNINWNPKRDGLSDGTYEFYMFDTSAWGTSKNINELNDADICYGKMIVTVGSNRDECEFYFDLDKVAQKLGCDVSDFKQISAQFGRLGQEWINTAGASSGAWLGLFICIAGTCGVVVYKKKKGSIQV